MFQKLPTNTRIYGLSAANPSESSWGTYCNPDDVIQGKHINSCLGDLFSVNFLEDIDKGNIFDETLVDQFKIVQKLTSLSHVMQWGDLSFQSDKVSEYVAGPKQTKNLRSILPIPRVGTRKTKYASMNSRTMKLQSLSAIYATERSPEVFREMSEEMASMQRYDTAFKNFDTELKLNGKYDSANIEFECLRTVVDSHEQQCGRLSDYGLQFVKNMAEACEKHEVQTVLEALKCWSPIIHSSPSIRINRHHLVYSLILVVPAANGCDFQAGLFKSLCQSTLWKSMFLAFLWYLLLFDQLVVVIGLCLSYTETVLSPMFVYLGMALAEKVDLNGFCL